MPETVKARETPGVRSSSPKWSLGTGGIRPPIIRALQYSPFTALPRLHPLEMGQRRRQLEASAGYAELRDPDD